MPTEVPLPQARTPEGWRRPRTDPSLAPSEGVWPTNTSLQNCRLRNYKTINFWCSKHPSYGILLRQPSQTNILVYLLNLIFHILKKGMKVFENIQQCTMGKQYYTNDKLNMLCSNYDLDRYLDTSDKTKIMQIN